MASKEVPWTKYRTGRKIDRGSDNGLWSSCTVVPRGAFDDEMIETCTTKTEVFATASGRKMPNYGEQRIRALSTGGICMNITAQVTDVKKPLISVQGMCRQGNRVILKEHGLAIRNCKTGIEIPWRRGMASA